MNPYERWSLIAQFAGIMVVVIASIAGVWQLRLLAQQIRHTQQATLQDHERRRKQATLEFYASTHDRQAKMIRIMPNVMDVDAIAALIQPAIQEGDGDAAARISSYLTLYEYLAAGVRADVFDLDVINQAAGAQIVAIAQNYLPYIQHRRELHDIPDAFIELEWLGHQLTRLRRTLGQMPRPQHADSSE